MPRNAPKPFRAAYHAEMLPAPARFCIHVIGYRQVFEHVVDIPGGTPCWFLHHFRTPVPVMTSTGVRPAGAHTFIALPPHTPLYHGVKDRPYEHSWIRLSGTAVGETMQRCGIPSREPLALPDADLNESHLLGLHGEMHHPRGADLVLLEELFRVWLRRLHRAALPEEADSIPAPFRQARQILEMRYRDPLTLGELASHCHLSRSRLCKGFREHYGTSPIEFAIALRLHHAEELLEGTELSIAEVARQSGVGDVYYFSRLFKQRRGLSPRAYRKARSP